MDKHMRVYAGISMAAIDENFKTMRGNLKPGMKVCAVIKTNAYGHGACAVAHHLEDKEFIWGFAVASADEARSLREDGITKPILILGFVFEEDYPDLVRLDIRPALFKEDMARKLSDEACRQGKQIPVHLTVDTGMSRIGVKDNAQSVEMIKRIRNLEGLYIEGMFTHFARADEKNKEEAVKAFHRFDSFRNMLSEAGIEIPICHCANSAAILELPQSHMDMVRAGITIYGIYPSDEMDRSLNRMYPVMSLKSHIAYIKTVESGTAVSYGGTFVTERETKIATIPVGYGDGYPRSLSNKGNVLIRGKRAPIIGRVCMDQFMVDVTDIDAEEFDEVTLLGRDGGEEITIDELGELSGRFPYEFICDINPRVPRIYE